MTCGLLIANMCSSAPKYKPVASSLSPLQAVLEYHRINTEDDRNPHELIFYHEDGHSFSAKEDTVYFCDLPIRSQIDLDAHTGHETKHSIVIPRVAQEIDCHSPRNRGPEQRNDDGGGGSITAMLMILEHLKALKMWTRSWAKSRSNSSSPSGDSADIPESRLIYSPCP